MPVPTPPIEILMRLRPLLGLLLVAFAHAGAQQRFTTQVMILPAFSGPDRGTGGKAADIVRDRLSSAFPRNELRMISAGDIDDWLRRSGFEQNAALTEGELKELAKKFRADERVTGTVSRSAGRFRVDAALAFVRDLHLMQPASGEGATVSEAADIVARDLIAARRQVTGLRQCENFARESKYAEAASAAAAAIVMYPRAVPARMCLLGVLVRIDAPVDSIIAVANATLGVAPQNPVALEDLAQALDSKGKAADASPIWLRLLATDSSNVDLVERVVNALAREGKPTIAAPIVDRVSEEHPDNLPLLKLRWLVHLASNDWKGAVAAGDKLLANDLASQSDPEFHARFATALRADSQPQRALSVAAAAAAKFPKSAPLYVVYLQMLRAESQDALPRGLAAFPENGELHAIAAQTLKSSGNSAGAMEETKRALAVNPRLPHGYLQLAQLELDAGQLDSAYASMLAAPKFGEDSINVAQFALARGNTLYKAATGTQKRDDYLRAMKFLSYAAHVSPSPEAKFLLGASALSVSQSAANEAPSSKSCDLSRLADSSLTEAEINLASGGSVAPDAAKQYLDFVAKLRPYVADELKNFCGGAPR